MCCPCRRPHRRSTGDGVLSNNGRDDCGRAKAASARVPARGPSWPPVPGVLARDRMSRGGAIPLNLTSVFTRPGLAAVGQFSAGRPLHPRWWRPRSSRLASPRHPPRSRGCTGPWIANWASRPTTPPLVFATRLVPTADVGQAAFRASPHGLFGPPVTGASPGRPMSPGRRMARFFARGGAAPPGPGRRPRRPERHVAPFCAGPPLSCSGRPLRR